MFSLYTDNQLTALFNAYPWFTAARFELVRRGVLPNSAIAPHLLAGAVRPNLLKKQSVAVPPAAELTQPSAITSDNNYRIDTVEENIDISVESVTLSDDLISETLAQIYAQQGLTDKAVETYRKLSLKFPEKSAYFALLIKQLTE